jgi:hypothetical protein
VAPGQGQDGADGQVDVAIGDHEGEADREQPDLREGEHQVEGVVDGRPEIRPEVEADGPQDRGDEQRRCIAAREHAGEAAGLVGGVGGGGAFGLRADDCDPADLDDGRQRLCL